MNIYQISFKKKGDKELACTQIRKQGIAETGQNICHGHCLRCGIRWNSVARLHRLINQRHVPIQRGSNTCLLIRLNHKVGLKERALTNDLMTKAVSSQCDSLNGKGPSFCILLLMTLCEPKKKEGCKRIATVCLIEI